MRSIEAPGGQVCVDIFRRPDGTWGFEEYRRDPEDGRGWQVSGHLSGRSYRSQADAETAARAQVPWLGDIA